MTADLHLRMVRRKSDALARSARHDLARFELVRTATGETVGTLSGIHDAMLDFPLDGAIGLRLTVLRFEETFE